MIKNALMGSLDTFFFATAIGFVGSSGIGRRQITLAFAMWDLAGSILGLCLSSRAELFPMWVALPLTWMAYLIAPAMLLLPNLNRGRCLYLVPALLSLDNLVQALQGESSTFTAALISAIVSGMFAVFGVAIGAGVKAQITADTYAEGHDRSKWGQFKASSDRFLENMSIRWVIRDEEVS